MANKLMDPIGRLMGLRYKSHPWHGIDVGPDAPNLITCFIEMVPTDTVKYEVDKVTGYLRIDRPQKYSNGSVWFYSANLLGTERGKFRHGENRQERY